MAECFKKSTRLHCMQGILASEWCPRGHETSLLLSIGYNFIVIIPLFINNASRSPNLLCVVLYHLRGFSFTSAILEWFKYILRWEKSPGENLALTWLSKLPSKRWSTLDNISLAKLVQFGNFFLDNLVQLVGCWYDVLHPSDTVSKPCSVHKLFL